MKSVNNCENVVHFNDNELFTVQLNISTAVLRDKHLVTLINTHSNVLFTRAYSYYLCDLRLFLSLACENDTTLCGFLSLCHLNYNSVLQWFDRHDKFLLL